jgi:hypothetical protein
VQPTRHQHLLAPLSRNFLATTPSSSSVVRLPAQACFCISERGIWGKRGTQGLGHKSAGQTAHTNWKPGDKKNDNKRTLIRTNLVSQSRQVLSLFVYRNFLLLSFSYQISCRVPSRKPSNIHINLAFLPERSVPSPFPMQCFSVFVTSDRSSRHHGLAEGQDKASPRR